MAGRLTARRSPASCGREPPGDAVEQEAQAELDAVLKETMAAAFADAGDAAFSTSELAASAATETPERAR
jgi:hypothetical protein